MKRRKLSRTGLHARAWALLAVGVLAACTGAPEPVERRVSQPGHLSVPRIFFSGKVIVNVGTGNNNNVLPVTLPDTATLNPKYVTQYPTRAGFRKFMETVQDGEGRGKRGIVGGWNYYGNMRVSFDGVNITGAQLHYGTDPAAASLGSLSHATLHAPVSVMADLHPAVDNGASTRWIFEDLVIRDAAEEVLARLPLGSATFYWFVGPHVRFYYTLSNQEARTALANVTDGDVAAELHRRIDAGAGLAIDMRLGFGDGLPDQDGLAEKFAAGEHPLNSFKGPLVGVISPWYGAVAGEQPLARYLQAEGDAEGLVVMREHVEAGVLTLDFASAIPPKDATSEQLPTLSLVWESNVVSDTAERLGSFSPAVYDDETVSDLVDLPFASSMDLSTGGMRIEDAAGNVLFRERKEVVAPTSLGVWFDEGETRTLQARLFDHGLERHNGTIYLRQYGYDETARDYLSDVALLQAPASAAVENGVATFSVTAIAPGRVMLSYSDDDDFPAAFSAVDEVFTTFVRVLPGYDEAAVSDEELTWDLLYADVLQYYDVAFPAMIAIHDIGDEATMRSSAADVLRRLVDVGPESPFFMPVSRDLPAGKRRLLERWLRNAVSR